ncbi:MAG: mercuric reductase [Bacteroidota bacterium]|nr:mercuric reductase [Bacteroidota bacterium]
MKTYDAIVIGSGQAGGPLAKKLALAGKKTALIEKRFVGGTCINDGCTPTKTWIASAKAAYEASKCEKLGVIIKGWKVDMVEIKKRKEKVVTLFRSGNQNGIETTQGLDLIFGDATFVDRNTISINLIGGGCQEIKAELIFLNTGCKPFIPDITGLNDINYLTSTSILELDKVPKHLLIIGGNYVGLEFGQMFRRFGSRVTIIERAERIVSREDEDISTELEYILKEESIELMTNSQAIKFKVTKKGKISVEIEAGGIKSKIKCTHVLVAVGRAPNTDTLGLENAGVEMDLRGFINVNDKLETNISGIYALGDVKGGPAFTHISYNDYTIVYRNLLENANLSTKDRMVPYCMFTDPQLGRIGISESEARKRGLNIKIAKLPMANVARAIETGDTRGFIKAVVDENTKKILGAAVIGQQGGEIMSILQMTMQGGITYDQIAYNVFAHPLYSESLNNLFMSIEG